MSTYERVNYDDVESVSGAMHSLSDSLESEQVGVSIVRCDPGWRNKPHDHSENDHQEIYILLDGRATVVIDDDEVVMQAGDALWIPPAATRQIRNGDTESAFVLVSAPASRCRTSACTDDDLWATDSFIG
jgi:quercetin dioxygenase-like cupin family protein